MTKRTAAEKKADKRIEAAYRRRCSGIEIDIMDIGRVFKAGHAAIAAGADEPGLEHAVRAFVETIRKN